jgi:hypothetical protein
MWERKRLNQMRDHFAIHILLSVRVGLNSCGCCGLGGCFTQFITDRKKPMLIQSCCPYHYSKMNYTAATKSIKTSPSTNVPVHCALCLSQPVSEDLKTIWKYNSMHHITLAEHSLQEDLLPPVYMSMPPPPRQSFPKPTSAL